MGAADEEEGDEGGRCEPGHVRGISCEVDGNAGHLRGSCCRLSPPGGASSTAARFARQARRKRRGAAARGAYGRLDRALPSSRRWPPPRGARSTRRSSPTTPASCRSAAFTACTSRSRATPTASRSCSSTADRAAARCPTSGASSTPTRYRIVLFDQRGCGKSTRTPSCRRTPPGTSSPTSSACAPTSTSSAGRCSAARGAARSRWPTRRRTRERVTELVLRGIFLLRRSELRVVLPGRRQRAVPRRVGAVPRPDPGRPSAAT